MLTQRHEPVHGREREGEREGGRERETTLMGEREKKSALAPLFMFFFLPRACPM